MSKLEPEIPTPTRIRGRLYFERLAIENYKRRLLGLPLLERDPREPIELVSAIQVSEEFGRHRRTIGRRILDAQRRAASVTEATESGEAA
jgi:hypothetical protein